MEVDLKKYINRLKKSFTGEKLISIIFLAILFIAIYSFTSRTWQDYVLMFSAFVLTANLLPSLLNSNAVIPRWSSFPTAVVVLVITFTFYTLELWLAVIGNFFNFLVWLLIFLFRAPDLEETEE